MEQAQRIIVHLDTKEYMTLTSYLLYRQFESALALSKLYEQGYLKDKMNWLEEFKADIALARIKKELGL